MIIAMIWAVAVRLMVYLSDRPMHIDELRVVQNLAERGFAGLVRPLAHEQFTPVGVLWVLKALVEVFGYGPAVLRLWPLLAGLAAVAVTGLWVWRAMGLWPGAFAVVLLAAAPKLIDRAAEVKQYSTEMLATAAILCSALHAIKHPGRSSLVMLAIVCVLCVLFSHASVFVIAGVFVAMGFRALVQRERSTLVGLVVAVLPAALGFLALYFINYRHGAESDLLANYWADDFMPAVGSPGFFAWWPRRVAWLLSPVGFPFTAIAGAGMLLGLSALIVTRRWTLLAMITLPMLVTLLAAVVHVYPFSERMVLFLSPLVAGLIAIGLGWLTDLLPARALPVLGVAGLAIMTLMTLHAPLTKPLRPAGRFDLTQAWSIIEGSADPVLIDSSLRYHYFQSQRVHAAPNHWLVLPIMRADRKTDPPTIRAQRPPGDLHVTPTQAHRLWVLVPDRVFIKRNTYQPMRDAFVRDYQVHYNVIQESRAGGVTLFQLQYRSNSPTRQDP